MSDWDTLRDNLGLKLRPIERWPQPPTSERGFSPFRATLRDTLKILTRELRMLNARSIVLQIAIREGGFRLDGLPRADARTEHPGVILSFESQHGPLMLPCDTFRDWRDNLRAIGMHLENLRHAGLYGVGRHGEQYRGWKQLGEGASENGSGTGAMTLDQAAELLSTVARRGQLVAHPRAIKADAQTFELARRKALIHSHSDRGGSDEEFLQVTAAVALIKQHLGL